MDLELEALNVNEGGLLLECKKKKIRNILSGTSYVFNYLLNQTSLHNVPLDESNIQIVDKLIIKVKHTYCSTVSSMDLFSFIMFDLSSVQHLAPTPFPHHSQTISTSFPHFSHTLPLPTPFPNPSLTLPTPFPQPSHTFPTPFPHPSHTIPTPFPHHSHTLPTPFPHPSHTPPKPFPHHLHILPTPFRLPSHTIPTPFPDHSYSIPTPFPHPWVQKQKWCGYFP